MVKSSIVQAFQSTDNELNKNPGIDTSISGSTCICVLAIGKLIYCANLGDSAAYIIQKGSGINPIKKLSKDHLASDPEEAVRIGRCGGRID